MRRSFIVGSAAAVFGLVVLLAIFGPLVTPSDPNDGELIDARQGPSGDHWLGTDYLGRDVLSRIIAGARVAMIAGVEATAVALAIGLVLGMSIGLAGGWIDRIVMRLIDGISSIPALVLAIAIIAALGAGLTRSMFAVGVAFGMSMTRLVRGLTLSERERLYVDGARVIGASRRRLLVHHIAPNIAGPIAVQATLVFASAVTIEAGLSFLGLGVSPPQASWGSMLASAQRIVRQSPFQAIPPGLAIVVTVLSINVLGDAVVRRRRGASFDHPTGFLEPAPIHAVHTAPPGEPQPEPKPKPEAPANALLRASGVSVTYGPTRAVIDAEIEIAPGEVVALVGESGSGKTSFAMALAGLLTPPARIEARQVRLDPAAHEDGATAGSIELVASTEDARRRWRSHVGVVFQEPSASLNPLQTVGRQLRDVIVAQRRTSGRSGEGSERVSVDDRIVQLLTDVGLPRPAEVARLRPGQISGGMAQRVMIALALAKEPVLLIADEPTTALDVTVQHEIITLLRSLCAERHFGVLLVTHDLGVASELADRCIVMLRGRIVETATVGEIVNDPQHRYTASLVAAVPRNVPGRPILDEPAAELDFDLDDPEGDAGDDIDNAAPRADAIEREVAT